MVFAIEHIITAVPTNDLIYILGAVLGGSLFTGAIGLIRFKKQGNAEKEEIITRAAEKAVNVLQVSLTRLEIELEHAKGDRDKQEANFREAISDRAVLEEKVRVLTRKVESLQQEVEIYRDEILRLKKLAEPSSQV